MKKNISLFLPLIALCCTACNTDTITITYNGNKAEVSPVDYEGVEVKVDHGNVKIKNNIYDREITFVLKGNSSNGSFALKTDHSAKVKLDGVDLTSNEGAALDIKNRKMVSVIAADGTDNTITITACEDTARHHAAAIHAKDKITFGGKGTLNVIATGKGCKGVNVKDDLTIEDLTLNVTTSGMYLSEDTTNHGFPGFDPNNMPEEMKKQFEEMRKKFEEMAKNGEFPPMPGGGPMGPPMGMGKPGEGIPAGPPMGMGMPPMKHKYIGKAKAIRSTGRITINSGIVTASTSTPGAEGIEGKKGVTVNDGEVSVNAVDDAINANELIFFNGGRVVAISKTNDAVDVNLEGGFPMFFGMGDESEPKKELKSAIIINGGEVLAWSQAGPPEEGLDCDFCPIEVSGGTIFSIGAGMGKMPSVPTEKTAKQPTALLIGFNIKKDEMIEIFEADDKGNAVGEALERIKPSFDFANSSSLVTSPQFKKGKKYVVKSKNEKRIIELKDNFTIVR